MSDLFRMETGQSPDDHLISGPPKDHDIRRAFSVVLCNELALQCNAMLRLFIRRVCNRASLAKRLGGIVLRKRLVYLQIDAARANSASSS
jgi:hypothetical protein